MNPLDGPDSKFTPRLKPAEPAGPRFPDSIDSSTGQTPSPDRAEQSSTADAPHESLLQKCDGVGALELAQDSNPATWRKCCDLLKNELPKDEYATWIHPLQCLIVGSQVWISAPNQYAQEKLESGLLGVVQHSLQKVMARESIDIKVTIGNLEDLVNTSTINSPPSRLGTRGRTSDSVVERAQLDLFQLERRGQFIAVPISPQNEFPTLLTRLPIFIPGRAAKQREALDHDNALPFETSWGTGRKFGPPLTVYDEDTLMALGRLRQNMLIGHPSKMPYPVSQLYANHEDPDVHVHVIYCMLSDIQAMCGTSTGGRNNKLRLASVRRLAATKIEFNKATQDKVNSTGTTIDLIHVKWDAYQENAVLYVQFSPIMASWLERAYTYIDWNLRRKLRNDVGKAVHRFLSGQPTNYVIFTKKLQATIGHTGPYKHFMADLRAALEQLQSEGWLQEHSITGNGRKYPHKLNISR